ncbi:MAG: branched-chain amino acid ABC transporter permease [Armatimonadota bacterium]|nr:branched-chain amino acid ABC transporter permease [Armatimonadota bacterium]
MISAGRKILALHLGVLAGLGLLQFVLSPFHQGMVARVLLFSTYAIGYNLLLGYTGLMSLGHALFLAAGLYGAGLPVYYLGAHPAPAFFSGVLASLLIAALVGALSLRTTGVAFSIVTMMFGQVGYLMTLYFNRITLGDQGLVLAGRLSPLHLGNWTLTLSTPVVRYNLALLLFAGALLASLWLVRSPFGRVLVGLREHEERARMLGYSPFLYRWLAIVISGGISGAVGAAYALLFSHLSNAFASILYSIYPLLWVLLGGAGTTLGPLVGVAFMTYAVEIASSLTSAYLVVVGLALVLVIMGLPHGIMGGVRARWGRWFL